MTETGRPEVDRFAERLDRLLSGTAGFALRRPRAVLTGAALLLALSALSFLRLDFHSEVTDLVPASVSAALGRMETVFKGGENCFLLIRAPAPGSSEALVGFAETLAGRLRREPLIRSVSYGWAELAAVLGGEECLSRAPLLARPSELAELDRLLTPEGIAEQVRKQALRLGLPGLGVAEDWVRRDPLEMGRFFISRLSALRGSYRFSSSSLHSLSEDGRSLLVEIEGNARSADIPAVQRIIRAIRAAAQDSREALQATLPRVRDFEVGLTGGYQFAFESEAAVRGDLTLNVILSPLLVLALVAYGFRRPILLIPSMVPLAAGIALGFGLFSALRREVVTLAFVSGALLAGLGINYFVYLTLRTFPDPRGPTTGALLNAVRATGRSIVFAALTTAAAFLSFPITAERFLTDLGLLSAAGILCCLLATFTILPAMLAPWVRRADRGGFSPDQIRALQPRTLGAERLARVALAAPRWVLSLSILAGLASAAYLVLRPPQVESDLRNVHIAGSEAIRVEEEIAASFGGAKAPIVLLVEGDGAPARSGPLGRAEAGGGRSRAELEEAAVEAASRLERPLGRLLEKGLIAAWTSPAQLIPPLAEQRSAMAVLAGKDAGKLEEAFCEAVEAAGFDREQLEVAARALGQAVRNREPLDAGFLRRLGLSRLVNRMVGSDGRTGYGLILVDPAGPLWRSGEEERVFQGLQRAIEEAGVRGEVTGLRVISARSASALLKEFLWVTGLAAVSVVFLVVLLFRRFLESLLALLPVTLGTLWMAVACDLLHIRLNFMNVGILPLVLGTGVDVGIHMVRQYFDDPRQDVPLLIRRLGASVMLASLTTLASFGTLAFSVNRGLASVGAIAALGMVGCVLASLLSLTAALELHRRACGGPGAVRPC